VDNEITLSPQDPTVFAKCPKCTRRGNGVLQGRYYGTAYTRRKWDRKPQCENCGTPMELLHEVKE
jgi:ribosomal protein L34E